MTSRIPKRTPPASSMNGTMNTVQIDRAQAPVEDAELSILENIYSSQKRSRVLTQRDLAEAAGLSLGMTNALLKRFSDKGWVLLKRLNARNIQYALTPEGVNEIAHRTYRYFRRTARAAGLYRDMIEAFVMDKKRAGANRLVLAGVSDLDFLIEYACERHGLLFVKTVDASKAARLGVDAGTVIVHAEGDMPPAAKEEITEEPGRFPDESLSRVIVGLGPERRTP